MDHLKALDLGLGFNSLGQPASSPASTTPKISLQHFPSKLTHYCSWQGTDSLLSCPQVGSPSPSPLPHQGQVYCAAQVRCQACSPKCLSQWKEDTGLQIAGDNKGQGQGQLCTSTCADMDINMVPGGNTD